MKPDAVDILILQAVKDGPAYKAVIHERTDEVISIASIGRRVELLFEADYLDRTFIDASGSASVGYKISAKGQELLDSADVCPDCKTLKRHVDHIHTFVPATEYNKSCTEE